ncbi:MAG: PEP-CTERM sorting domain-containing protein [bacterium]|nr:PEP-CTERM sorting domain-containing protein [bacterium]
MIRLATKTTKRVPTAVLLSLLITLGLLAAALPVSATTVTFNLDTEFSGATSPSGVAPWASVEISDLTPTSVAVTFDTFGLTASEFVSSLALNLTPSLDLGTLVLSSFSSTSSLPTYELQHDSYKMDGDGYYDLKFSWSTSQGSRFTAGSVFSFVITGLQSGDFLYYDQGGSKGDYYAAAHVQGIGTSASLSGWIGASQYTETSNAVPEPATLSLLGLSLLGATLAKKRKSA